MHIAFVDESGDLGSVGSPTRHFILCAVVVHHLYWAAFNKSMQSLRLRLQKRHGLRLDAEIHTSQFLAGSPKHLGMEIKERFQCVYHAVKTAGKLPGVYFARVCIKKSDETNTMDHAWLLLMNEIDASIIPETRCQANGLIVLCDHHTTLPYRPPTSALNQESRIGQLLELPLGRDSKDSHALQLADILAYLTRQSITPNTYFSKSRGRRLLRLNESLFGKTCPQV